MWNKIGKYFVQNWRGIQEKSFVDCLAIWSKETCEKVEKDEISLSTTSSQIYIIMLLPLT